MYAYNVSGQRVYFTLLSAISGNPVYSGGVGSLSGAVSGYVSIDGAAQGGVGGYVTEDGFGQYHLNGFAADFAGRCLGFYFTTVSGVVPVSITATTTLAVSGQLTVSSGLTWVASGSPVLPSGGGVGLLSGQSVLVYSGQLSGQLVVPSSGQTWLASGSVVPPSGGNVGVLSGTLVLPSGGNVGLLSGQSVQPYSGQWSGQPVSPLSGQVWAASGSLVLPSGGNVGLLSGQFTLVYSGQLSGQLLYPPSGAIPRFAFASGVLTAEIPADVLTFAYSGTPTPSGARCLLDAVRKLRNKWAITSGQLTVFGEDDATAAYLQPLTATSGANPLTEVG